MVNPIIKLRIFLWSLLVLAVFLILYMFVVPSGKITYVSDLKSKNSFIGDLSPKNRVIPDLGTMIGDPVYFSLYTPRKFNTARLTLKYKKIGDFNNLPIIESGVLVDGQTWRYNLAPVENQTIDMLDLAWSTIRENNTILLQREDSSTSTKKYARVEEFLEDLPNPGEIGLYNYDLKTDYVLENYSKSEEENDNFHPIRGSYEFYTYIKDEELDFKFSFFDLNKNKDEDSVDIHLYYSDEIIDSKHLGDDGNTNDNGKRSDIFEENIKIPGLPEGVYKIEIKTNDDIVTQKITTKQQKIAFINNLWLTDRGDKKFSLFTDSKILNVKTTNPDSLQKINFKGEILDLNETYKQFSIKSASTSDEIYLEKDGVIIAGSGVFGFNAESLVNPKFKKIDSNININDEGINYVLADYQKPIEDGDWRVATIDFDLSQAYREDGKYNFVISVPGLLAEEKSDRGIEIDEVRFDLTGTSLLEFIKR